MKLVLVLTIILLLVCQAAIAETSVIEQATQDAERDAKQEFSVLPWIGSGFACSIFGVGFAYLSSPRVPASRLIGKSPVYISVYSLVFKENTKRKRLRAAMIGCVAGSILNSAIYLIEAL